MAYGLKAEQYENKSGQAKKLLPTKAAWDIQDFD
jgi:hypothetical protein